MDSPDTHHRLSVLAELAQQQPSSGLMQRIMQRIHREREARLVRRMFFRFLASCVAVIASVALFVPVFSELQGALHTSGFSQFASLIFSDIGAVFTYWQEFALSLLESVPVASFVSLFAVVFVFLAGSRYLLRDAKRVFTSQFFSLLHF